MGRGHQVPKGQDKGRTLSPRSVGKCAGKPRLKGLPLPPPWTSTASGLAAATVMGDPEGLRAKPREQTPPITLPPSEGL